MKSKRILALAVALTFLDLTAAACNKGNPTPSKAFQTLYEAMKNKDVKAMKSTMSKESLEKGEKASQRMGKSFDAVLKETLESPDGPKFADQPPEFRNEIIASDGKTATLEVNDHVSKRGWTTFYFTKEDDGWKIDLEK